MNTSVIIFKGVKVITGGLIVNVDANTKRMKKQMIMESLVVCMKVKKHAMRKNVVSKS